MYMQELATQIKQYKYQLNATFSDICTSDFCENRTGFSGTPYLINQVDRIEKKSLKTNPISDISTEGSIYYSLLNNSVDVIKIDTRGDIINILKEDKKNYSVLIDVAAYFVGDRNIDVAKRILANTDYISHVLFLDDDNNQVIINKDNLDELIYVTRISQDYISSIKYLFVYFDQKHITGVDVKLIPLNAKGLVTIKYNTTIRDYGQGTYRLRKINQTQSIDLLLNNDLRILYKLSISIKHSNIPLIRIKISLS